MSSVQVDSNKKNMIQGFIRRGIVYCLGLFLMALGVVFSVKSNLGVSPVSSIPYIVSRITNIELGLITTIVFSFYVLIQILILRKEFKIYNLLQILCASVFGNFITLANKIVVFEAPSTYILRLIFLLISIVLIALGILFYLTPDLVPQPSEGLIGTISKKINMEFSKVKIIFDSTSVGLSALLSFVFLGELDGIREGTIIAAVAIGKVLGILSRKYKESVLKFCFGKDKEHDPI